MRKLQLLRQAIIDANPSLQRDPDQLLTFIEQGSIRFHVGEDVDNLSHQYTFTAQIVLLEFGGDVDAIIVPLLRWLSIYEPGLAPDDAVTFEAEVVKNNAVDLVLSVQLTERVVVYRNDQGAYVVEHRDDPRALEDYGPRNWQLIIQHNPNGRQ